MNVCPEWLCGVVRGAQSVHEMTHGGRRREEDEWKGGKMREKGTRERKREGGVMERKPENRREQETGIFNNTG